MNLDHRRAQLGRRFDLRRRAADEQRHPDAGMLERMHHRLELRALPDGIEPALGGALGALFRHQADRMRLLLSAMRGHLLGRRHFEIERLVDLRLQPRDVVVADMAAVLAQMRGDAVGAGGDGELGRAHRIGMAPAARIADGGDVVDVDAEAQTGRSFVDA